MITALDKNTALILIDLQKGIVAQNPPNTATVLAHSAKLIDAFREARLPIVIVHVRPSGPWLKTRKDAPMNAAVFPDDFTDTVPEIKTMPGDIFITKTIWGAFYETGLDEELKKRNITGIVIGGIATSIGVEATARAACERGYNLSFPTDAMTDMKPDGHAHSIKNIFPRIGEVGTTADVIDKLQIRG